MTLPSRWQNNESTSYQHGSEILALPAVRVDVMSVATSQRLCIINGKMTTSDNHHCYHLAACPSLKAGNNSTTITSHFKLLKRKCRLGPTKHINQRLCNCNISIQHAKDTFLTQTVNIYTIWTQQIRYISGLHFQFSRAWLQANVKST